MPSYTESPQSGEYKQVKYELNEFITNLRSHFVEEQIVFPLALRANLPRK